MTEKEIKMLHDQALDLATQRGPETSLGQALYDIYNQAIPEVVKQIPDEANCSTDDGKILIFLNNISTLLLAT